MKIRFIRNAVSVGMAYFAGDVVDVNKPKADELIALEYAEIYTPEKKEIKPELPGGLPGRQKLIDAGIFTIDEIKAIGDLTAIDGIGNVLAQKIKQWVTK